MDLDHWRAHKNGDGIPIPDPPPPRRVTPPPRPPVLIAVPRTLEVPEKYSFPNGFNHGPNERVRRLNEHLLDAYAHVGWMVNDNSYNTRRYNANDATCDQYQRRQLSRAVDVSARLLKESVILALNFLSEIDAIGGQAYVHIPPQLAETVVLVRAVPTGSLHHLAQANSYFVEHDYPLPPGVLIGRNQVDNFVAHENLILRRLYEELAFNYNRMNFLIFCGDELRNSDYYADLYDKLWKAYDSVFNTIRYVLEFRRVRERPYYGETFSFPADLKEAVEAILSIVPTSSKWTEEKQRREMKEKHAEELKEKEKERLKREQLEEEMWQREEAMKQREETMRQREADLRQREKAMKQREEAKIRWEERARQWEFKKPVDEKRKKILQKKEVQRKFSSVSEVESDEDESDADGEEPASTPKKKKAKLPRKKHKMSLGSSSNPFGPLCLSDTSSDDESSSEDEADADRESPAYSLEEALTRASEKVIAARKARTLHMGNIPWKAEFADVKSFFKDSCDVVDVHFPRHDDGSHKGFCFVEFVSADAASKALKDNQSKQLMGRKIVLGLARIAKTPQSGKHARGISNTIFIRGFDKSLAEDEIRSALKQQFGECGEITSVSIPTDYETGTRQGIAFVDFKEQNSIAKALKLNGSDIGGCMLHVAKARGNVQPEGGGISGGRFGDHSGGRRGGGRFGDRSGGRDGGRGFGGSTRSFS